MTSEGDIQHGLHKALQANKDHQYALRIYSERIDSELESLNKLLAAADVSDTERDTIEVNSGGWVVIPSSVDAVASVLSTDLFHEASPFRNAALRRQRFVDATVWHPWKTQELEALADTVKSENHRLYAVEAQLRGQKGLARPNEDAAKFMEENIAGIDWERVSVKVSKSSLSGDHRSAKECEIKWLGERHPRFNHSQWTQPEIDRVKQLISNCVPGQINWVDVAERLGTGRTPVACMQNATFRRLHVWDLVSDQRLRAAVETYGTDNWTIVARLVSEDATPQQCQNRYTRYIDPNIKHGLFTEDEDKHLRDAMAVFGNAWQDISQLIPGRTNEQCRERAQELNNASNPKRKWTDIEDRALLETVGEGDAIDWKEVSKALGTGRTENQCRNRYGVLMRRVARTTTPGSIGTLRSILPAPPPASDLSQIAGTGSSHAGSPLAARIPNAFRPILPAPMRQATTLSSRASPSGTPQAHSPTPPPIPSAAEMPVASSIRTAAVSPQRIHQAFVDVGALNANVISPLPPHLDESQRITDASLIQAPAAETPNRRAQAAQSQEQRVYPPGDKPVPPRPRPRPRRKQARQSSPVPTGPPSSVVPPWDIQEDEVQVSMSTGKGKGKARESEKDPNTEETTHKTAHRSTKHSLDIVADSLPMKRRLRKRAEGVDGSSSHDASTTVHLDSDIDIHSHASEQITHMGNADTPAVARGGGQVISSRNATATDAQLGDTSAVAAILTSLSTTVINENARKSATMAAAPIRGTGKRGRHAGPRPQPTRQLGSRRSMRLQHCFEDPLTKATVSSAETNTLQSFADDSSELSSPPSSP